MKFSEMTYTRPDINALLARCKQLAAKRRCAGRRHPHSGVLRAEPRLCGLHHRLPAGQHPLHLRHPRCLLESRAGLFDANGPAVTNASVEISRAFLANPYVDALTEHFGTTCVAGMKNAVLGMDDRTVELQQEFNALVSQYQQIYGAHWWSWTASS